MTPAQASMYLGLASTGPSLLLLPPDSWRLSFLSFTLQIDVKYSFCGILFTILDIHKQSGRLINSIMLMQLAQHHCMLRAARGQGTQTNTQLSLGRGGALRNSGEWLKDFSRGVTGYFCASKRSLWCQCGGCIWSKVWDRPRAEESGGYISNQRKRAEVLGSGSRERLKKWNEWTNVGSGGRGGIQSDLCFLASITGFVMTPLTETGLTERGMQFREGVKRMSLLWDTWRRLSCLWNIQGICLVGDWKYVLQCHAGIGTLIGNWNYRHRWHYCEILYNRKRTKDKMVFPGENKTKKYTPAGFLLLEVSGHHPLGKPTPATTFRWPSSVHPLHITGH